MIRLLALAVLVLALAGCGAAAPGTPAPALPQAPPPQIVATGAAIEHPVRVDIPRLGVSDDVVPVGIDRERRMEIPPVDQVGWYEHSVLPGEAGPAVLAGHRNWAGVDGAFLRIGELQPGDEIVIADEGGHQLTFAVYEVRSFPKAIFDYGFIFSDRSISELVLVTCSGDVVDRSYTDNTAVAARLVPPT